MIPNVGNLDRVLRFVLGLVLLSAPFFSGLSMFEATWVTLASCVVGAVMIIVSVTRVCPVYSVLGVRTCRS